MSEQKTYSVYRLTFPDGKTYVGFTGQKPEKRWRSGWGYYCNKPMFEAILDYGWRNIKREVLFQVEDKDAALVLEQYFIDIQEGESWNEVRPDADLKRQIILCKETEQVYTSVNSAAADAGVSRQSLSRVLNNHGELCGGRHWQYITAKDYIGLYLLPRYTAQQGSELMEVTSNENEQC